MPIESKSQVLIEEKAKFFLVSFFIASVLESLTTFISFKAMKMSIVYALVATGVLIFVKGKLNEKHSPLVRWCKKYASFILGVVYLIILILKVRYEK